MTKIHLALKLIFVSDLHLGHDKDFVWRSRGFGSAQEYTAYLLDELERIENKDSTVLVNLGDCCLTSMQIENFDKLASIPFAKHFVINGNHNAGMNFFKDKYPKGYKHVTFAGDYIELNYKKQIMCCMHYPILSWNHKSHNSWAICGHCHGSLNWINPNDDAIGKILDVGVDNALIYGSKPYFTFEEVSEIMSKKEAKKLDHH